MRKRVMVAASIVLAVSILSVLVWNFYKYETTVLAISYEANPATSSPLSRADYSWEAKAYSAQFFGNSPFDGEGYIHRERITSENRFKNAEFHNLTLSLRLRFQITNSTGYMLCNRTFENTDGCNRQVIFEFNPEAVKAGNTLQIRITLNLNVNYNYGAGGEPMQLTLQKEWTKTVQVQRTEPATGANF